MRRYPCVLSVLRDLVEGPAPWDPEAGQAHLIYQVQDGAHTIISPATHKQADMRPAPWM